MQDNKKVVVWIAAVVIFAGAIVFGGQAVRSANAAFSSPSFFSTFGNEAVVPELGVVELKGTVEAVAAESYTVSGLTFRFDSLTIISGAPAVGDSVEVKGLTLPDLTRYALTIDKQDTPVTTPEFEFFGLVEVIAADSWTISSEVVQVDAGTLIDSGIAVGTLVEVKGSVVAGVMLAEKIELKESMPGEAGSEVKFFGTVESITGAVYLIGGKTVNTDAATEISGAVAVGGFVKVQATLHSDGTYLASEIKLIDAAVVNPTPDPDDDDDQGEDHEDQDDMDEDHDEQEIKVTGVLESMTAGLWVVNGINFVVNDSTKIEGDPQLGDTVKVEAHVQSNGTNLAHEIELEDDNSDGDDSSNGDDDGSDSDDDGHEDDDDHDDDYGHSNDDDDDDEDDRESGPDSFGTGS